MRINHNIAALNTYRQLTANGVSTNKALEKLSSGLRINKAGDDAAGLAISEKMRGQIRGLEQASSNAQDAISLIQTAEGALNETHSILQRMRELSIQAANGTATDTDRNAIQDEVNQLLDEIDRIGDTTEFNTKKLLNGSSTQTLALTTNNSQIGSMTAYNNVTAGTDYNIAVANVSEAAVDLVIAGNSGLAAGDITYTGANFRVGDEIQIVVQAGDDDDHKDLQFLLNGQLIDTVDEQDVAALTTFDGGGGEELRIAAASFNDDGTGNGTISFTYGIEADYTVTKGGSTVYTVTDSQTTDGLVRLGDFRAEVDHTLTANAVNAFTVAGEGLTFQIGANENQTSALNISDMRTSALGVNGLDVNDRDHAEAAITTIESAIQLVSDERAKLGSVQNRLEHSINNLGTSSENMSAAESRIRDVDMAKEMMEFTKQNILAQAAQAMLAQANQQPQGVLQLLR